MLDRLVLGVLRSAPPAAVDRSRRIPLLAPALKAAINLLARPLLGKEVVIAEGEAAGLRLCVDRASVVWATGRVELPVQRALAPLLHGGDVFFDVGANVGFYTVLAARLVGARGRVVAFEPHPDNVAALRRNVAANGMENVLVVPKAVSSSAGPRRLDGADRATARLGERGREVEAVTLDEFVAEHVELRPAVVKIDVEGHELDVLAGAAATLEGAGPAVLCEQHGHVEAVVGALARLGYTSRAVGSDSVSAAAHILATTA